MRGAIVGDIVEATERMYAGGQRCACSTGGDARAVVVDAVLPGFDALARLQEDWGSQPPPRP